MDNNQENTQIDPIQASLLKETWFSKWHLYASWLFMVIVAFDFLIAPVGHIALCAYFKIPYTQWQPETLGGAGIFFIAFMMIIGVSTYGKNQQLLEAVRNMPDYSNAPFNNPMGSSINITNQTQATQAPSPPPEPLQAAHRGIPKG